MTAKPTTQARSLGRGVLFLGLALVLGHLSRAWPARTASTPQAICRAPRALRAATLGKSYLRCADACGASDCRPLLPPERRALGLTVPLGSTSAAVLATVPGLTPRLGKRLEEFCRMHGEPKRWEDLRAVRGIGPKRLALLAPHVTLAGAPMVDGVPEKR